MIGVEIPGDPTSLKPIIFFMPGRN